LSELMKYKGYYGSAHYSNEDKIFHGRLENIRSLVSYHATGVESLIQAFREAVEDYLDTCDREGIEPEIPFKGSFNVRLTPEIHRDAAFQARSEGVSFNQFIKMTLEERLYNRKKSNFKKTRKEAVSKFKKVPRSRKKIASRSKR